MSQLDAMLWSVVAIQVCMVPAFLDYFEDGIVRWLDDFAARLREALES